jgi:hypothetical protein
MEGFDVAVKEGSGTYTISGLTPVTELEVREGVLQINSDYQLSQSGLFPTVVTLDGSYGQLRIVGTGSLNGTLAVEREQGLYREHMTYDVITADVLNGSFSEVLLPESKPLLVFSMEQTSDTVQISVTPLSFASVASNEAEQTMGEYLDRIAPNATGGLSDRLSAFQVLPPGVFSAAFASLSPALYDSGTTTTFDITSQYSQTS